MLKLFPLLTVLALVTPASATPARFEIAVPESLMVNVPNFGPSRYETVAFCLQQSGVEYYQDLVTDTQNELFEGCMVDMT